MASWLIRLQWKSHQSSPKTSWNILVCMAVALEASGKLGPRNPFFGSPKSKIYFFALMSDSYELHLIRSQISYWSHCCQMRSKSRYLKPGSPKYTFLGFFNLAEISLFCHFSGFSFFPFLASLFYWDHFQPSKYTSIDSIMQVLYDETKKSDFSFQDRGKSVDDDLGPIFSPPFPSSPKTILTFGSYKAAFLIKVDVCFVW